MKDIMNIKEVIKAKDNAREVLQIVEKWYTNLSKRFDNTTDLQNVSYYKYNDATNEIMHEFLGTHLRYKSKKISLYNNISNEKSLVLDKFGIRISPGGEYNKVNLIGSNISESSNGWTINNIKAGYKTTYGDRESSIQKEYFDPKEITVVENVMKEFISIINNRSNNSPKFIASSEKNKEFYEEREMDAHYSIEYQNILFHVLKQDDYWKQEIMIELKDYPEILPFRNNIFNNYNSDNLLSLLSKHPDPDKLIEDIIIGCKMCVDKIKDDNNKIEIFINNVEKILSPYRMVAKMKNSSY